MVSLFFFKKVDFLHCNGILYTVRKSMVLVIIFTVILILKIALLLGCLLVNRGLTSLSLPHMSGSELRQIIYDSHAEVNSSSSDFWMMVAALKVGNFYERTSRVITIMFLDVIFSLQCCSSSSFL